MDNLIDKVQEMLSDPESMQQIQELANMLTSEMNNTPPQSNNNSNSNSDNNSSSNKNNNPPPMADIPPQTPPPSQDDNFNMNNIDFGMIFKIMQLFNSVSNSQDEKLLLAIKPYLTKEKQAKVDKAIKLMKAYDIFTTAKESGLLNNLDNLI